MRRTLNSLIVLLVLLTPIFGLQDYLSAFGIRAAWLSVFTDLKILKDLVFLLFFVVSITVVWLKRTRMFVFGYLALLLFFAAIGLYHTFLEGPLYLIGFRAFLPFFVFIYAYFFIQKEDMVRLNRSMRVVFYLLFVTLVAEYFFTTSWGKGPLGFNQRACGFLFYPSPAAGFVAFFYWLHRQESGRRRRHIGVLIVASLIMISSAMGYVLFITIFLLQRVKSRHYLTISLSMIPLVVIFLFVIYPVVSGRSNFDTSFFTRADLLSSSIQQGGLLGVAPGYGTNLFTRSFSDSLVLPDMIDNTFASLNWQYGVIASLALIFVISYNLVQESHRRLGRKSFVDGLIIIGLMGMSISLQEFFPMNLVLPLVIAFFYREVSVKRIAT